MFKGLGDVAGLLKQAQQMRGRFGEIQESLGRMRVEGNAGGGMVRVTANGQQKILGCQIDPSLWETGDREMLEDLVVAATNQALEKARGAATEEFGKLAGGLDLSNLSDMLSKLGLGDKV